MLINFHFELIRLIYRNLLTTNVLGPLTKILLNVAIKSGPRLKLMLSNGKGSSATVLAPSIKSPDAKRGRILLISFRMHSSGFGMLREHGVIADAIVLGKERKKEINT